MQAQCIDLTGKKFNKLTVIAKGNGYYTKGGQYKTTWICRCDCGNVKEIASEKIRKGHTQSCGCVRKQKIANVNFDDITGMKFDRLTVIRFLQPEEREDYRRQWLCKCECGNEVQVNSNKLRSGHTRSCGCLMVDFIANLNKKYKYTSKRLYSVYKGMLSRCYDKTQREYHNYGKRGIVVCQEWLDNFDNFAEWAYKNGYKEDAKHLECTLDRQNVDKGYSPDNCRWVSNQVQQNNRRDCIYAEYNGEVHTCMEWSKILGMTYQKVHYHLKRGKTIAEILNI
jgi:hypothetical protein